MFQVRFVVIPGGVVVTSHPDHVRSLFTAKPELAPKMQAITLDVIMSGIFGIEGAPAPGTTEHRLKVTIKQLAGASTSPLALLGELSNLGTREARRSHAGRSGPVGSRHLPPDRRASSRRRPG